MKIFRIIPLITCCLLFFSSCETDKFPFGKEFTCSLSEAEKRSIPYKAGDTLNYLDEDGNFLTLRVVKDIAGWKEVEEEQQFFVNYEYREVGLKSDQGNLVFLLNIDAWEWWFEQERYIYIRTNAANLGFRLCFDANGKLETCDSVEINRRLYYNVVEANQSGWQIFYNTDYGVLQLRNGNKAVFTLIP